MDTKGICGGENVVPTNISSMPFFLVENQSLCLPFGPMFFGPTWMARQG
jgi:hypothetical protein